MFSLKKMNDFKCGEKEYGFKRNNRNLRPIHVVSFDVCNNDLDCDIHFLRDKKEFNRRSSVATVKDPITGEMFDVWESSIEFIAGEPFLNECV